MIRLSHQGLTEDIKDIEDNEYDEITATSDRDPAVLRGHKGHQVQWI